jgi:anaerobic magnesium-protoporphyrin IX monomethyl ester cyclase
MIENNGQAKFQNLGTHFTQKLTEAKFPSADAVIHARASSYRRESKVDILLVNPPAPDRGIWIRSQHRVGRRSRENMIWPQVSLAQLAAILVPDYKVEIIDAIALRMTWKEFEQIVRDRKPLYYLTQVIAPTLTNDMYGVFLAKSVGAKTIAFGTHVTPMSRETIQAFPALDYILRGEPELTLRELLDTLEQSEGQWKIDRDGCLTHPQSGELLEGQQTVWKMWQDCDAFWKPAWTVAEDNEGKLASIKGLVWRKANEIMVNGDRHFIKNLDDLPIPLHRLLPLESYRMPLIKGPYTFIVTSRGCPAGCTFCIKHVSYQYSIRLRSAQKLHEEICLLYNLGVRHIHMYADMFTVSRDQVVELCMLLIQNGPKITWTANSRVDYVDEEMLQLMGKAGCTLISWGIESASEEVLKRAHKGYKMEQAPQALQWSKQAGIMNWGYFIIGLPGDTVESIQETIKLSKALPLDICLFHVAAPHPGTPFFFDVIENGWFRPDTRWEEVDMDQATVLDYPELKAEDLLYWQKRAFREWSLRPGPILTMIKSMNSWAGIKSAMDIGLQTLGWIRD